MDKWLLGLVISAVALPLLLFIGNVNVEAEEASHGDAHGHVAKPATPELFLGYANANVSLGNGEGFMPGEAVAYTPPASYGSILPDVAYLGGLWGNDYENLELLSVEGRIVVSYTGRAVNVTAAPGAEPALMQAIIDGILANSTNSGSDVSNSMAVVNSHRAYSLVSEGNSSARVIEINMRGKGLKVYSIVFG